MEFTPKEAFYAAISEDGDVYCLCDISSPLVTPTVVVDFEVRDVLSLHHYYGIYHVDRDMWEIFGLSHLAYAVVAPGSFHYDCASQTASLYANEIRSKPSFTRINDRYNHAISVGYPRAAIGSGLAQSIHCDGVVIFKSRLIAEKNNVKTN